MRKIKQPKTMVKWGHEDVSMLEMFTDLNRCVAEVVRNMYDMDGDL